MVYPDYKSVEANDIRAIYEKEWNTELDTKKGLTVVEIMDAVHAGHGADRGAKPAQALVGEVLVGAL